jgi:hypothetical protein
LDGSLLSSSTGFSSFLDEIRSKVAEHSIWGQGSPVWIAGLWCDVVRVMTQQPISTVMNRKSQVLCWFTGRQFCIYAVCLMDAVCHFLPTDRWILKP